MNLDDKNLMIVEKLASARGSLKQSNEIDKLKRFSARIGRNPFLVQASTGNASIKIDDNLWIKASGKWLADAQTRQIFVAMQLALIRELMLRGDEIPEVMDGAGKALQPSIETPMHAVLPDRVVIHVHSVSTIAWAVQQDGESQLAGLLAGLSWRWIPYVDSGMALGRKIRDAHDCSPEAKVFVLANHGLVICGPDCNAASRLLTAVEERIAVVPRTVPAPNVVKLLDLASSGDWELPADSTLHALGTDPVCNRILGDGVLYPCQSVFFRCPRVNPFVIVEGCGVLLSPDISRAELAMLTGLAHIVLRVPENAPLRYLSPNELRRISTTSSEHYRELADHSAAS